MKKQQFWKKLKSQRGANAADIIIAVTIIVLTMTIVSMIYVNTTFESRNITRTAGATRIATNILENIEKLSYSDFVTNYNTEISGLTRETATEYANYYLVNGGADGKAFSTKIPNGYKLYIKADPNYGSHVNNDEQFDIVRDVNIIIAFKVGNVVKNIDFQTVKTREIIEECNSPRTSYLANENIVQSGMKFYPIKYLKNSNIYVKTTEEDDFWYNYSNKEWATVVVSRLAENKLFDTNGKFIGTINTTKTNSEYTEKFVWIPRFFVKNSGGAFYSFAYLGTGTNKIISTTINSVAGSSSTLTINTYKALQSSDAAGVGSTNFDGKTGKWVSAEGTSLTTEVDAKILSNSKYGPYSSK